MTQTGTTAQTDLYPTRYSLLSRLQDWDDQDSWRDFFETYWRLIYSVAIKSGLSDAEAQDVVQETVVCVAKDIAKFKRDRERGSFRGWLRNLTRWRINDQLRKRAQSHSVEHGRYVAFYTTATNLVPAATNASDIFIPGEMRLVR